MTESTTQFFAPRARLVDVATNKVIGGGLGGDPSSDPVLDLVSARVTLVNSGVGQLQVVLNNQIYDHNGLPATPPWLYNSLDRLTFGQRVRLELCYGDQITEVRSASSGPGHRSGTRWTKMIVAQINDMQFSFPSSGGAQVTIIAEDLLSLLKRKPNEDKRYDAGQTESQIVSNVVSRAGGSPAFTGTAVSPGTRGDDGWMEIRGPLVAWPAITEDLPSVTHQKSQTYLQFLQSIADRLDFEIYVDFAKNYLPLDEAGEGKTTVDAANDPDPTPNEVLLHFEPARSRLDGGPPSFVVDLAWGLNLVDFSPKLKVWDLPTKVKVSGRNPATVERVQHHIGENPSEVDAVVSADLGRIPGGPFLQPSTKLRREFFSQIPDPEATLDVDFTNLGAQRARLLGEAKLREKHREMVVVEASTIGFPSLRAGIHVDISRLYAPFDGLYYVTKAVHSFDSSGYRTQISLRRPGLQSPSEYPWSITSGRRPDERSEGTS